MGLFAVPLSFVNPRSGRSWNLIFAVLIYVLYNNCLSIFQAWTACERIASPRFDGERFRNMHPIMPGRVDLECVAPAQRVPLRRRERRVPSGPLPAVNPIALRGRAPSERPACDMAGTLGLCWPGDRRPARADRSRVGAARASPSRFAGPKRFQPAPVALRAMPPLDLVVISHDHYDHLDYPTLREMAKTDVPIVTSLGVGAHLEAWGVRPERITELDWWETYQLPASTSR